MKNNMKIEFWVDEEISKKGKELYTVSVDGEVILECLSEEELKKLKISEITELAKATKEGRL